MNEQSDTFNIDEVAQSAQMASLNEEIAPKTDSNKSVFQRVGSLIGRKKSNCKDKTTAESEEDLVPQLTKKLQDIRKEHDGCKIAHLTSEAEKKELLTMMEYDAKLKSAEIEKLKAEREYEAKLNAKEIENLKIAHLQSQTEKESVITRMDCEAKLRSAEIDILKAQLNSNASRMTEMDDEITSKSVEIEKLKTKVENEAELKAVEIENLKITSGTPSSQVDGQLVLKSFDSKYIRAWKARICIYIFGPLEDDPWYVDLVDFCRLTEQWQIIEFDEKVLLRAFNLKFMRAHPDGRVDLAAAPHEWETWTPCKNDDDTWSFRSCHGKLLSANREDGMLSTREEQGECEKFRLESW